MMSLGKIDSLLKAVKNIDVSKLGINAAKIVKNVDFSRAGKEVGKIITKIDVDKLIFAGGCGIAIGALSRQPEVNKLKKENNKVLAENELLRFKVKSLNRSTLILHQKLDALKAYSFTEKAKETAELKGCIKYQYATKEYIELAILKSKQDQELSHNDMIYMTIFSGILNGEELSEEEYRIIENRVMPKYGEKIEKLIKFDCLQLLEQLST